MASTPTGVAVAPVTIRPRVVGRDATLENPRANTVQTAGLTTESLPDSHRSPTDELQEAY